MPSYFLSNVDIFSALEVIDLVIMGVIVAFFLATPKIMSQKKSDASNQSYLLMNHGLTLPLFVATLTSTWYGGIFGVTQIAFENGLYSFVTQGLSWYASYFLFALILAKKIRQSQVLSLPELVGLKFGPTARKLSAFLLFFHALPVTYAVSVGLLLQMVLGLSLPVAISLGVAVVAIYSILGGFKGVVLTDALQFLLMFASVGMIVAFSFYSFGGLTFLSKELPDSYFNWRGENSPMAVFTWFLIACSTTLVHPVFYQRCLAAKSDKVAVRGILIAIFFWFLFDCCTTLGGMYAKALMPEADSAKAYLFYGLQLLPSGLRGLFISGILATILSTLDSFLFVSGTSVSYDMLNAKKIGHQSLIACSALLTIIIAIFFQTNFENMWLFREGVFGATLILPVSIALLSKVSKPLEASP
jgi:SSS family solute:Na+ symporter